MPFIDDALLWCPDNDGRIVGGLDLATCIPDESADNGESINATVAVASASNNDPNNLNIASSVVGNHNNSNNNNNNNHNHNNTNTAASVETLCNSDSSDELFRTLSEGNFEIESLLSDLATVEVKVENEENNNNVVCTESGVLGGDDFASLGGGGGGRCSTSVAVVANDDLMAKDNVTLNGVVDSVGATLADDGTGSATALLGYGSASAASMAAALCGGNLVGDLSNNNNNNNGSNKCNLLNALGNNNNNNNNSQQHQQQQQQQQTLEPRFATSAAANPLLVEKLMSKCLNIEKRMSDFKGKS